MCRGGCRRTKLSFAWSKQPTLWNTWRRCWGRDSRAASATAIGGILLVETPYKNQSRVFLALAGDELSRGDLYQAAEKGWGAAAQIVKAVADARGWEHDSHRHLFNIVRRLVDETDDDSLSVLFSEANLLHANFYEGELSPRQVAYHLSHVTEFVNKVEGQLETG